MSKYSNNSDPLLGEIQTWLHIEEHFDAEQTDFKTQKYLV